ncbi:MAG TPA: BON domain-containing protein [Thermoanaerobaculia bacterium]|jgi:osmotically-inducible protein OsmY|nr:BON domain-containing protein [Thermoanaerobaculia bacterium]
MDVVDLTPVFQGGGIDIDGLMVYKVGDIVLIRGRTSDTAMATEAGRFAKSLGYQRVSNLIVIVSDIAIERVAGRALDMARPLEGCRFQVSSRKGVVSLRGHVGREIQKDYAVALLRKIDGVKAVHFD